MKLDRIVYDGEYRKSLSNAVVERKLIEIITFESDEVNDSVKDTSICSALVIYIYGYLEGKWGGNISILNDCDHLLNRLASYSPTPGVGSIRNDPAQQFISLSYATFHLLVFFEDYEKALASLRRVCKFSDGISFFPTYALNVSNSYLVLYMASRYDAACSGVIFSNFYDFYLKGCRYFASKPNKYDKYSSFREMKALTDRVDFMFKHMARGMKAKDEEGFLKLVVRAKNDRVIGCLRDSILLKHASEGLS